MTPKAPRVGTPRALDRALSLPLLDDVYRVASMDKPAAELSELLTIALREHTSDEAAENKMKKTVTRIWMNPPEPAIGMIRWAVDHPEQFPDHRVLQMGALLATTPFVGSVVAQLGRSFNLNEAVTVPDLRRKIVAVWGSSSTINEAVGKTVTTLRRLGIVDGGGRTPVTAAVGLTVTPLVSTWLVHAVMLARQAQSLDTYDAKNAAELFWVEDLNPSNDYPLLETHTEGVKRRIWAVR